jgi:hypothetical protein
MSDAKKKTPKLAGLLKKSQERMDKRVEGFKEVRHDPATAQAPGVFRPIARTMMTQEKRHVRWETETTFGNTTLKFKGHYLLDSFDLTTLLALIAIAGKGSKTVTVNHQPKTDVGKELRTSMLMDFEQLTLFEDGPQVPVAAVARFTKYELSKLLTGDTAGQKYDRVMQSLERLAATSVYVVKGDLEYYSNIVSGWVRNSDAMAIAVHPLLTEAMRSQGDAQYIRLTLDRVLTLKTQVGKLLYAMLSARVFEGKSQVFTLDTLVSFIYAHDPATESTQKLRDQRRYVREGMADLAGLDGWVITKKGEGFTVARKGSLE